MHSRALRSQTFSEVEDPISTIGIDYAPCPFVLSAPLDPNPVIHLVLMLQGIRATRDAGDTELVKHAGVLSDVAPGVFCDILEPVVSEIELCSTSHRAMERTAGARPVVLADLASGTCPRPGGGEPSRCRVGSVDVVLCDLAPQHRTRMMLEAVGSASAVPTARRTPGPW